jgi:hypothetical protein
MADLRTVDVVNAIRNSGSAEYQSRIPLVTRDNLASVGSAILQYEPTKNEFVDTLVNKIAMTVITNKGYQNPIRQFKKGMMEWGKTIEEIYVDIIAGQTYDPDDAQNTVFKRYQPNIKSIFHEVNREQFYPVTIEETRLKRAFASDYGFSDLVGYIVSKLYDSDEQDEFLIMKNLPNQYAVEGKFKVLTVAPVIDEVSAKAAITKIKALSNKMDCIHPT